MSKGTATQKRKCSVCGKSESRTAEGAVQRFAGENRYTTAAIVSSKTFEKADTVVIAFGENYPDALSVNPTAAIKNAPIIYLNDKGTINKTSKAYLESVKGSVKKAYVIVGEGVVPDDMLKQAGDVLGVAPIRLGGQDRYETCTAVHETFKDLFTGNMICIATGDDFIDALIGGVYAAINRSPLFLAAGGLNDAQKAYLRAKAPDKLCIFGGEGAVPDELLEKIAKECVSG